MTVVYYCFYITLLDSIFSYFVENFCACVHEDDWSGVFFS